MRRRGCDPSRRTTTARVPDPLPPPPSTHRVFNTLEHRGTARAIDVLGRLFSPWFREIQENLGDFPAALSRDEQKGKECRATGVRRRGEERHKGVVAGLEAGARGCEETVRNSDRLPDGSRAAMSQMFGLVRVATDSGIDRTEERKKLFSIYRPISARARARILSRLMCISRERGIGRHAIGFGEIAGVIFASSEFGSGIACWKFENLELGRAANCDDCVSYILVFESRERK